MSDRRMVPTPDRRRSSGGASGRIVSRPLPVGASSATLLAVAVTPVLVSSGRMRGVLIVLLLVAPVWAVTEWVDWRYRSICVTRDWVDVRLGVFGVRRRIPAWHVTDVSHRRTVLGALLGYGTIMISNASATTRFDHVPRAGRVCSQIRATLWPRPR